MTKYEMKARELANDFLLKTFHDDDFDIIWFEYTKSIEENEKVYVRIEELNEGCYFFIIFDKITNQVELRFWDAFKKEITKKVIDNIEVD